MIPELLPVEPEAATRRGADDEADPVGIAARARVAGDLARVRRRGLLVLCVMLAGIVAAVIAFAQGQRLIGLGLMLPVAVAAWYFFVSPILTHRPRGPQWPDADGPAHERPVPRH